MRGDCVTLINFGSLGCPEFLPVPQAEMSALLTAAEHLLDRYSAAAVDLMLQEVETDLLWHAITEDSVDEEWVSWATLTYAIRGLRGESLPAIQHLE
jgi:hypothetical protein